MQKPKHAPRRLRNALLVAALVLGGMNVGAGAVQACPNCKEAVITAKESANSQDVADGYNWSILLMIAVPMIVVSTGTMMVVRAAKQGLLPPL